MTTEMTTTWTPEQINELLATNDRAVERAILTLYQRQTAGEQSGHVTVEKNGVGFNAFDADFLSSLAEHIQQEEATNRRPKGQRLSPRQRDAARKALRKYAVQLAAIANGRA